MEEKHILIVEDDPVSLRRLWQIVGECCPLYCEISGAASLREAYRYMEQYNVSLFIVAVMLQGETAEGERAGYAFVEEVRKKERYRFTPVIFVNAGEASCERGYKELHCLGYVQKPFDAEELGRLVLTGLQFPVRDKARRVRIKQEGIYVLLEPDEIVYLRADRNRLYIRLRNGELREYRYVPLKDILVQITSERMLLCRKGMAVNEKYIDCVRQKERKLYLKSDMEPIDIGHGYLSRLVHSAAMILP